MTGLLLLLTAPLALPADLAERAGITLYLPFEDAATPAWSRTGQPPTFNDSVHYVDGRVGRAALLRTSRELEEGKTAGRASGLNYDAAGLLYGERGTVAFWFQPRWDGDDPQVRSGPNQTGPSLFSVSSLEPTYYQIFLRWNIKGGAFYQMIYDLDGQGHGTADPQRLNAWRRGEWHHLVITWDAARGVRHYQDGERVYEARDEAWPPATPATIGIGCEAPTGRPETTRAGDLVLDELFLFDRMLDDADVRALLAADYAALSPAPPAVLPAPAQEARRQAFALAADPARAAAQPTPTGWALRAELADLADIETRYIQGRFLSDGLTHRRFKLSQGGLEFDRDVELRLSPGEAADYVVLNGRPADGSKLVAGDRTLALAVAEGTQRWRLPVPAESFRLELTGGSQVGEVQLWRLSAAAQVAAEPLGLLPDPTPLGEQAYPLWREFIPADRRALAPGGRPGSIQLEALGKLHLFTAPAEADGGVAALCLSLGFDELPSPTALALKLHDPFEPDRFRARLDLALPPSEGEPPRLDLELRVPGLVLPEGSRLWLELVADQPVTLRQAALDWEPVPTARVAAPFARSYRWFLNEEFRTRMAHNFVYYSRGIQTDNPLTRGLANILRHAPDDELAQAMHHWARLSPWPAWPAEPPGPAAAPRWARLQMAAIESGLATIRYWVEQRQDAGGYVVGNADSWNDDTKLFNEYAVFALLTGDEPLIEAMERYLAAHYASGRMVRGFSGPLTDVVHSQEEASYLVPTLAFLRYGDPVQMERLFETCANLPTWTAPLGDGRHFRSNYYNAEVVRTEGHVGHDVPLNAATLVPADYVAWYNGDPRVTRWLAEYAAGWTAAAARAEPDKAAGLLPAYVDVRTGEIGSEKAPYVRELCEQLIAATRLTGDRRYLAPIEALIRQRGPVGVGEAGLTALEWRRLSDDRSLDGALLAYAERVRGEVLEDHFFQRGVERYDVGLLLGYELTGDASWLELGLHHAWRNNQRAVSIYTLTDPDKDRVYPWGKFILPAMMCGGQALNVRASGPLPTVAVTWAGGSNLAAWVTLHDERELTARLYNFGSPRQITARFWQLRPGRYALSLNDRVTEVELRRGGPLELELPAGAAELVVTLREPAPAAGPLPDAALSPREIVDAPGGAGARRLTVPVHNLGLAPLPPGTVRVRDAGGRVLAAAAYPALAAPDDLQPRRAEVTIPLDGAAAPAQVELVSGVEELTLVNNAARLPAP